MPPISFAIAPVTAMSLLVAPVGDATLLLGAAAALNLTMLIALAREFRSRSQQAAGSEAQLYLMRRTLPHLRARRPMAAIEAQVRWRHAAETRRRRREAV